MTICFTLRFVKVKDKYKKGCIVVQLDCANTQFLDDWADMNLVYLPLQDIMESLAN